MSVATLPGGARLWYRKTGAGAPLLHIHGSAFGYRNFEKMTPLMARQFEVIDFDLPGYGDSVGAPATPDFPGFAKLVRDLIVSLGYERVHVHGTSFGAMIALTLAASHPEVVDRLVLSCFLARYDRAARMMRATWKRAALEIGMDAVADLTSVAGFARSFYERPGADAQLAAMRVAFAKNTPQAFVAGTEMIERTDLSSHLDRVRAPTLLLGGDEDNMTPFSPAASGVGFAQIRERLSDVRLEVLPQCGHYLVIEQPERAAELIVEHLSR
jgi:pimeloyl-ACP methyl ester carboxylesterase